jgi:dihydroorotate dehydrogenase (fumarate)
MVYVDIARKVRETVSIPIIMKIGKSFNNIPALAHLLKINGVDGIVLFNRLYQPDINIYTMQIVSGTVFSSHSDLSDTLRWTAIVSGKISDFSVASSTGVHDWEDVVKCLLAGASAVQMVSAIYTHGPEIISQILICLEEWMNQAKYYSLSQFQGALNYAHIKSPNMYERAQFMKYFSSRD